jgi:hypothetical protein
MKKFDSEPSFISPSFSAFEWLQAWQHAPDLAKQTRWSTFLPDHISTEEWQRIIGYDANNLRHMELQRGIVRQMQDWLHGASLRLTLHESSLISAVAIHHDLGELKVGDKQGQWKTEHDARTEYKELETILVTDYPFNLISQKTREEMLEVLEQVDSQYPASNVAQIFKVSEYIGYMRTMLRMWYTAQKGTHDGVITQHLQFLVQNVAASTGSRLHEVSLSKHYDPRIQAYILDTMKMYQNSLLEIINYCSDDAHHAAWLTFERGVFTGQGLDEAVIQKRLQELTQRKNLVCKEVPNRLGC